MEQTKQYLSYLDNKAQKFVFACYDYRKMKKGRQIYGSFDECINKLKQNNAEGFCVYVTINESENGSRKKDDIKRCRAIWVEDDNVVDKPRTDFPLEPSLIVQSSPGKYHYYWFTSTTRFAEWNAVMRTMVDKWGCDNLAKDISRVLRLPGFKHKKDLKSEFVCSIVSGTGKFYSWLEVKSIYRPTLDDSEQVDNNKPTEVKDTKSEYSEKKAINDLMESKNYHGSLVSISMSLTNKGLSRELQYMTLFGLMNKIPKDKRRPEWEHRVSEPHLYECIDTAINKRKAELEAENVELPDNYDPDWNSKPKDVIFPPGLMGQLCQEILEMAPYPNREIAVAGAFGLVAGIVGRGFNVLGMGLNIYIAILADSGVGKAVLKDSINNALRGSGGPLNIGQIFVGRSRFTGPKAVFQMLSNGLSRICVIEEAGLSAESKAGDQSGLTRVYLDLFTSSGYGKWAGDEGYSDSDNSIPALHSPALSIVNVSTPKSFINALRGKSADVSGEVARLWMMRSIGEKPYLQKERRDDFSTDVIKQLGKLVKICHPMQLPEAELKPIHLTVPDYMFEDANKWVDRENSYMREGDILKRTLCSRAWAKIMKIAAVCSVMNGKESIGEAEYKWAEACILQELNSISDCFSHESVEDLTLVSDALSRVIYKSIKQMYKDPKKNSPEKMALDGVFTYYSITQAIRNNTMFTQLDDDPRKPNPRTGLDKVLAYMINAGMIVKLADADIFKKYNTKTKIAFRITADFVRGMQK